MSIASPQFMMNNFVITLVMLKLEYLIKFKVKDMYL
jgi:hypothetical protein